MYEEAQFYEEEDDDYSSLFGDQEDVIYVGDPVIPEASYPVALFQTDVPYRIVQKQLKSNLLIAVRSFSHQYDSQAPPVLAIKDKITKFRPQFDASGASFQDLLNIGDEISVSQYLSATPLLPHSTDRIVDDGKDGYVKLRYHGIISLASRTATLRKAREMGIITKVKTDGPLEVWMTDTKILGEKQIPSRCLESFPQMDLKPGTRIWMDYVRLPAGTHLSVHHDLAVVPEALVTFVPYDSFELSSDFNFPTKISHADPPTSENFCHYFLSSVAFIESIYRDDMLEAVQPSQLMWNLSKPKHAQIIYHSNHGIKTGATSSFRLNYKNSLFRNGSIAILKRIDTYTSTEMSPVYIRIMKALYEENETKICFVVDALYLLKTWNLERLEDLQYATYKIEPTDLLCHLRSFNAKLAADKRYFISRLNDSPTKARILAAFFPAPNKYVIAGNHIRQIPPSQMEAEYDERREFGALTCGQRTAIKAILNGEEIVIVDGGCKMGKTTTMVFAIPGILQELIEPHGYQKCLALVSSSSTLPMLVKKIERNKRFQEMVEGVGGIRVLNLIDLDSKAKGSFSYIVDMLLKDAESNALNIEEKEILEKAKWSFQAKVVPQYHGNVNGPPIPDGKEMNENMDYGEDETSSDEEEEDVEAEQKDSSSTLEEVEHADVIDDLITSTELMTLQSAINIIFYHYFPNFVIASNDTLISLLPSLSDHITNIAVDEAGKATTMDVVAMVTESKKLEQLVLVGDRSQYPSQQRLPSRNVPKCFDNVMKMINLYSTNLNLIVLNKTFNLNPGLTSIMQDLFYPKRDITSLLQRMPLGSGVFGNPDVPLMFVDMDGNDIRRFPTTRFNPQHTYSAMNAVKRVLEVDPSLKITVLCYYEGQKMHIFKALRRHGLEKIIEVSTVDSYYGKTTDVAIVVTTRNLNERKHPRRYASVFKNGKLFLQRIPVPINETNELGEDSCFYSFVFDEQRLLTAISRGEKATFIIGSAELLRENEKWNILLSHTIGNQNFVKEPPQPAESVALTKVYGRKRRHHPHQQLPNESPSSEGATIQKRQRIVFQQPSIEYHQMEHQQQQHYQQRQSYDDDDQEYDDEDEEEMEDVIVRQPLTSANVQRIRVNVQQKRQHVAAQRKIVFMG